MTVTVAVTGIVVRGCFGRGAGVDSWLDDICNVLARVVDDGGGAVVRFPDSRGRLDFQLRRLVGIGNIAVATAAAIAVPIVVSIAATIAATIVVAIVVTIAAAVVWSGGLTLAQQSHDR